MDIIEIYQQDIEYFRSQRDLLTSRLSNIDNINYDFDDVTFAVIQKNNDRKAWETNVNDLNKRIFDLQKKIDLVLLDQS